jgi:iron complex transport system permease protein
LILVATNPWNIALALTWLSGSTYGRMLSQLVPVLLALVIITPAAQMAHRELDLLALDDDTPRIVGVRLRRARLAALAGAALLASTAVSAIGVVAFVGLVGTPYFIWLLWRSRTTAPGR